MLQPLNPSLQALISLVSVTGLLAVLLINKYRRRQTQHLGQPQQNTPLASSTFPQDIKGNTTLSNTAEPKPAAALLEEEEEEEEEEYRDQGEAQNEKNQDSEATSSEFERRQPARSLPIPAGAASWRSSISFPPRTRASLSSSVVMSRKGSSCARWGSISDESGFSSDGGSSGPGSLPGSVPKDSFFAGIGGQFGRTPSL